MPRRRRIAPARPRVSVAGSRRRGRRPGTLPGCGVVADRAAQPRRHPGVDGAGIRREVVPEVFAEDGRVGVVEREHGATARADQCRQRRGEAPVIGDIVQGQVAADQVEVLRQFRQGTAQVGGTVGDSTLRIDLARPVDQALREIDASHARAARCQDAGQETIAAGRVEHVPPGDIAQEVQQAGEDGVAFDALAFAPGDPLGIFRRALVPRIGDRLHGAPSQMGRKVRCRGVDRSSRRP